MPVEGIEPAYPLRGDGLPAFRQAFFSSDLPSFAFFHANFASRPSTFSSVRRINILFSSSLTYFSIWWANGC